MTTKIDPRENVHVQIQNGVMTITIQLENVDVRPSASGKTKIVASTGGFQNYGKFAVGLNVTTK